MWRSLKVFMLVVLVGPPIGGLLLGFGMLLLTAANEIAHGNAGKLGEMVVLAVQMPLLFVPYSYLIGGPPAVLTGLWLAIRLAQRGGFGVRETVAAAMIATAICLWAMFGPVSLSAKNVITAKGLFWGALIVGVAGLAALIGYSGLRRFVMPARDSSASATPASPNAAKS